MKRTTFTYVLMFSLALNIATAATLAFSWWKDQAAAQGMFLAQKPVISFLREDLNLTTEQANRVVDRIERTKPEFHTLKNRMESNRSEMMSLISANPLNLTAVQAKVNEINRIQGELRQAAVGTVLQIVELLPPEAKDKFGVYLRERGRICDDGCAPGAVKGPFEDH